MLVYVDLSKGKNMKILISLSKGLKLIKENYRQAKGNKNAGTLVIDPYKFLELTTRDSSDVYSIMDDAKTLEEYNQYVKDGSSYLMPWLEISTDGISRYKEPCKVGQVVGHEGRHRAAALIKAGIKKMPISVKLYRRGFAERFHTTDENPWGEDKWKSEDLPKILYGEFNQNHSAKIDTQTFKAF